MAIGKILATITQMFGGPVKAAAATTGQVLTKQADGSWAGAAAGSGPTYDTATDRFGGTPDFISSIIIGASGTAANNVELACTVTNRLTLLGGDGSAQTITVKSGIEKNLELEGGDGISSGAGTCVLRGGSVGTEGGGRITCGGGNSGVISGGVTIEAGSTSANDGGSITLQAASPSGGTNKDGGDVSIIPGTPTGSGQAGAVLINPARLILGARDTSSILLKLNSGTMEVREGNDSGYGALRTGGMVIDTTLNFLGTAYIHGMKLLTTANTADSTLAVTSTGRIHTNEGASGAVNLTLPTATATTGYYVEGVVQANQYLRFTAATGDTIRDGATVSATAGYIRSTTVGSTIRLYCINATEWIVMSKTGTWTVDS